MAGTVGKRNYRAYAEAGWTRIQKPNRTKTCTKPCPHLTKALYVKGKERRCGTCIDAEVLSDAEVAVLSAFRDKGL